MNDKNGSTIFICNQPNSTINKKGSVTQTQTKNEEIKDDVRICKYSTKLDSESQSHDTIKDPKTEKTAGCRPIPSRQKYNSKLETGSERIVGIQYKESPDSFMQRCQKESCSKAVSLTRYQSPCEPEYVHPNPPIDRNRRPRLAEPPEMLSNLKQGIRHPCQIRYRRKKMETQLDRLTDEHRAFAFPPDTRPFLDNVYYLTDPASSLVQNYDIITRDIQMQEFLECRIRPSLLALNREKYKSFRERLPMPEKRILKIPGNRTTHWHNWHIRPLRTAYSESWRQDIKAPDSEFSPAPPYIC